MKSEGDEKGIDQNGRYVVSLVGARHAVPLHVLVAPERFFLLLVGNLG
jgi:hypothetical protein